LTLTVLVPYGVLSLITFAWRRLPEVTGPVMEFLTPLGITVEVLGIVTFAMATIATAWVWWTGR
jgi:hypothetical protein